MPSLTTSRAKGAFPRLECTPEGSGLRPRAPTDRALQRRKTLVVYALALGVGLAAAPRSFAQEAEADEAPGEKRGRAASAGQNGNDASETDVGKTLRERIAAVSAPVFVRKGRFELAPFTGLTANDAFFERFQVGARASYHLLESLSLDAGAAANVFSLPLNSARLLQEKQLDLSDPTKLYGTMDVSVNFAPIYGKASLMSQFVVHFDAFVTAGLGAAFVALPSGGGVLGAAPVQPAGAFSVGARAFVLDWLVVRAEVKDYAYWGDFGGGSGLQNILFVNMGVGFYFPFTLQKVQVQKVQVQTQQVAAEAGPTDQGT